MADFHIRGRVERKGALDYAAIVLALPSGTQAPMERMQVVCATRAQAVKALHELTVAMGQRIREGGHSVVNVVTDE